MDGLAKKAAEKPRNTLYVFDYMGITVAHLGDMRSVPPQNEIESMGTVHIVLVPVGGGTGLNAAKAAEIVSLLEPNIVIPMHYATPATKVPLDKLDKFMKEMGQHEVESVPSLKITKNTLPDETKVIVLDYQRE